MQYVRHKTSQAFQALRQSEQSRWILIGSGTVIFVTILSLGVSATMSSPHNVALIRESIQEKQTGDSRFTVINPTLVSGSSSIIILGTVLSHETANIYPRRDGIVEDVYVDIGDTVQKNQVVALLLPKGVEGQSAAMIVEKQAQKSQAESDLKTAEQVAKETVIGARQQIKEKETELVVAKRAQEKLLQTFRESEANITQMQNQAWTTIQNARQLVEWILLGSNSRTREYIEEYEVLNNIGQLNASTMPRVSAVEAFNTVLRSESIYTTAPKDQKTDVINMLLIQSHSLLGIIFNLLQTTSSAPSSNAVNHYSYDELSDRIEKVINAQDAILKAQEKIEDAQNSFDTLIAAEPELYQAYHSGITIGKKSNTVLTIETQIQTAYNSLALIEANQDQMVERQRTQIDIADAMLQSEYTQSGHRQIRSPFAGIISKRFIDVGQIVMPSMSAFELTGVPTSLAKKAKTEIQFGLPEQMIGAIDIGDTVTFFLQTNETSPYTAEVTRKSPQVDMKTHTIIVQAKVSDSLSLPHRASIRVRLIDGKNPVFRIPSSAVKREAEKNYIWVVDPATQKPMQSIVSVIAEDGEFAEVTGMITVESAVILDPPPVFLITEDEVSKPMP
jgi:multidrug efflux pump subunit AcrA (membrane-fusion protein)